MKKTDRTIYLAGAMTGKRKHNYPKFFRLEEQLQDAGYLVVNPARLNKGGDDWTVCLRNDLNHIVKYCSGIALLDDWMISRGARLELTVALQLGMFVINAHTQKPLNITLKQVFSKHSKRTKHVERYKA